MFICNECGSSAGSHGEAYRRGLAEGQEAERAQLVAVVRGFPHKVDEAGNRWVCVTRLLPAIGGGEEGSGGE